MHTIDIPTRDDVSPENQALFDKLKAGIGMVPNLYATFAHSEHALGNYLQLQNAKSSITGRAREVVNLVDTIMVIGDKIMTNYLHATTRVPVDFPAAPALRA